MALGSKVYSPDIDNYSMEGSSGIYGTVASIFVGPLRLVHRVTHNIMILPANLQVSYASGLLTLSSIMIVIGIFDLIFMRHWPLLVSQIPVVFVALALRKSARRAVISSSEMREVNINTEQVEQLCDTIYGKLDAIVGKDEIEDE